MITHSFTHSLTHSLIHSIAPFLVKLFKLFRRWDMNVLENVSFSKPSLFIFDPSDEIINFPASLFLGITHQYYSQNMMTFDLENAIRTNYLRVLTKLDVLLKERNLSLNELLLEFHSSRDYSPYQNV